ncbi:hypothetical protein CEW46_24670 [Bacillus cereus]|nr:hypothetical protein CEW46_24670 [Bacillus cereus]
MRLGWLVRGDSVYKTRTTQYPENAFSGTVEALFKSLGATELVLINPTFKEEGYVTPDQNTIASMYDIKIKVTSDINDCDVLYFSSILAGVMDHHLASDVAKFSQTKQVIYYDADGELVRPSFPSPLRDHLLNGDAKLSNFIVPTVVMNTAYHYELAQIFGRVFYLPFCAPSKLEASYDIMMPKPKFMTYSRIWGQSKIHDFKEHSQAVFPEGRKKWYPPLKLMTDAISEYQYLLPSGYKMPDKLFLISTRIWEAGISGTSFIQYVETMDSIDRWIPDYPKELVITPDTNVTNFLEVLKEEHIQIPHSVLNQFSSGQVIQTLKEFL